MTVFGARPFGTRTFGDATSGFVVPTIELVVAEALHAHTADNITLTFPSSVLHKTGGTFATAAMSHRVGGSFVTATLRHRSGGTFS